MPRSSLAIALVAIIGAGILLFPMTVSWFSQYEQSQRIDGLTDEVADLGAATLQQRLDEARDYNAQITGGGANLLANERLPLAEQPQQDGDYDQILRADGAGLMGRLRIPSIKVDLPISHGTSNEVLEHGVGHLQGTAVPVGGPSTHSVLTAHRGLATSELFTHLDRVRVDDTFTIEVFGEVLTYRVTDTRVVEPTDTQSLFPVDGEDLVTLVTCTPLGVNSHRILVTGERVIPTPQSDLDAAGEHPEGPSFPWWSLIAGGVFLTATAYVWLSGRPPKQHRASTGSPSRPGEPAHGEVGPPTA
ncbi:class C sortase [Plantibacter sp. ME-Dv--P-122b]|uniref:class C sortase n=1 Tax=Plantibacter sp. ME-Dv--P-122b TaxID=3040300 RepID=UPI00254DC66B|nr:class C sortase [Plantibacter sp. ME-Dv--P-122b]